MNRSNERPLWIKELFTFALAFIILTPICVLLTSEGIKYAQHRETEHLSIQTKLFEDIATNESHVLASAEEWYDRHLLANVRLMTDSLTTLVSSEGYTGPKLFPDGFVLTFEGENAVFPEGMGEVDARISRELAEESAASGTMRTGRLIKKTDPMKIRSPLAVTDVEQPSEPGAYCLSFVDLLPGIYPGGL